MECLRDKIEKLFEEEQKTAKQAMVLLFYNENEGYQGGFFHKASPATVANMFANLFRNNKDLLKAFEMAKVMMNIDRATDSSNTWMSCTGTVLRRQLGGRL